MKSSLLSRLITYILRFLQLQLFLTLIAFPVLLSWGLPISLLTAIGNLIYGPFLAVFLLLSSLLFFTQMLHIPNGFIAWLLEISTNFWLWILKSEGHTWLYAFSKPHIVILLIIPIVALLILHYKKYTKPYHRTLFFSLFFIGCCLGIKTFYTKTDAVDSIDCNRGSLTIIHHKGKLVIIDPGVIGQKISATSWVEYTLTQYLIKTSGKTSIDYLILLQPSGTLFEAVAHLASKIKIGTIYLIYWQGSLTKSEWKKFFEMKNALQEKQIPIIRMGNRVLEFEPTKDSKIIIKPLKKQIAQKDISYPAITVSGSAGDKKFSVTSYKFKEPKFNMKLKKSRK